MAAYYATHSGQIDHHHDKININDCNLITMLLTMLLINTYKCHSFIVNIMLHLYQTVCSQTVLIFLLGCRTGTKRSKLRGKL